MITGYLKELRQVVGNRPLIVVGAGVLVTNPERSRLLLQRRTDNGLWGMLGGAMEPGETTEQTARREVYEESGLTVGEMELLDVFSGPELFYTYPNGDQVYNVCVIYMSSDVTGDLRLQAEEGLELRYWPVNALPENLNPPDFAILRRFREIAPPPQAGEESLVYRFLNPLPLAGEGSEVTSRVGA